MRKLRINYGSLGRRHGTVHRRPERSPSYSGGPPGTRGEDGRGEDGRRHASLDRVADGTRSRRQEAVESRRQGRRH